MTKHFLSSTATLIFALSATVACAQDTNISDPEKPKSEAVTDEMDASMEAAEETLETTETLEDEATKPAYDDWGNPKEIHADTDMKTDSMNSETVTVTCPEGTEVQSDGSCMVVGDWETEDEPEG